ncbi:L-threonylcarbamoyladenylate synthase [Litchfieldia salsa]|uniref:Threonylcarbamoyl-AMP synthase n=1 Tax=Litchfieldia salsa TaxID=930152 RepID=A0A1H0U510_9BACI|nr:L-threonylcarbamoyladenylate synthase [Litchfieldia salsa]SDP61150.1 translation factor SUA5 [Litchfieldia salsa]
METKLWAVDNLAVYKQSYPQLIEAAKLLRENEVVAFPTETVYGLGANATSDSAVNKIFEAKGRPSDNPLIVHIADKKQLNEIAEDIPNVVDKLIEHFWPGPLTLVLNQKSVGQTLSKKVTAELSTVAVRMPDHPIALALIKESGLPIAAPSANTSGKPSPTMAKHVQNDLYGKIAGIIDGGPTGVGLESTVLDCTGEIPVILRPGGVTKEQLEQVCGKVEIDQALVKQDEAPKSPGMKYTHYAPNAPLYIVKGTAEYIQKLVFSKQQEGLTVGVLTTVENESYFSADVVYTCGSIHDLQSVANQLYETLRKFDEAGVDLIYSESFPEDGIGQAIMNRLLKAAGHQVIYEE